MVRPNGRTYLDTTYGLGRWYDRSTRHDTTCQIGRWYNPRLFTWSMGRPIELGTGATHQLGHWRRSAVLKLVTVLYSRDVP
jgi:hypothetical protein